MKNKQKLSVFGCFLTLFLALFPAVGAQSESNRADSELSVEQILTRLNKATSDVNTYSAEITYTYQQPILESQTERTGNLCFTQKNDLTKLRINFETVAQDDGEAQKHREHYIFDGIWLAQLDYRTNSARIRQMAREDEPESAFELARENFPIIGFDEIDKMRQDFEVSLADSDDADTIVLALAVLEDSRYSDEYEWVEVSINKELFLPELIVAATIEGDLYRIELDQVEIDEELQEGLFEIEVPDDFGEPEVILLD